MKTNRKPSSDGAVPGGPIVSRLSDQVAAVVLAAGAGRRLRPLTSFLPKALCPVNNVALVDLALDRARAVTERIAVNVHGMRAAMEEHLAGEVHLSIEEPEPLGTAGAIAALRDWIDGRAVLALNADSWHRAPLAGLIGNWDGTLVRLLTVSDPQKPDFGNQRFAGVSLMPWKEVQKLKRERSGLYEACWSALRSEGRLELVESSDPFFDCGTPAEYLAANLEASGGQSVIGQGARIEGEVVRSVVWPGGRVHRGERLVDSIRIGDEVTVRPVSRSHPALAHE